MDAFKTDLEHAARLRGLLPDSVRQLRRVGLKGRADGYGESWPPTRGRPGQEDEAVARERWPGWVYRGGDEPDYRFSFANERTFLAWIRTALALVAAGVALDAVELALPSYLQEGLAIALLLLGAGCAVAAWARWATAERAMRQGAHLPAQRFGLFLACVLVAAAVALLLGAR